MLLKKLWDGTGVEPAITYSKCYAILVHVDFHPNSQSDAYLSCLCSRPFGAGCDVACPKAKGYGAFFVEGLAAILLTDVDYAEPYVGFL